MLLLPFLGSFFGKFFNKLPKGSFLVSIAMKITKYYIDKAKYRAEDEKGEVVWLEINYWENSFKVSKKNLELEKFAKKLLIKKHRINLVHKMHSPD